MAVKQCLPIFIWCLLSLSLEAQNLTSVVSRWDDSFIEWYFYTENEDEEGELKMRWQLQNDWSEWEYRLNDYNGTIKLKWRDNPNEWELRGNNKIVTARTLWNNDLREWRITDNSKTLTLKSKWGNQLDEWELRDSPKGNFYMYTTTERDPRNWEIADELNADISFQMKMMLMFIVAFHSSPKQ